MAIHFIDLAIIGAYLFLVVVIGFVVSRRAGQNLDSYFLGGKTLPWYLLGIANASSMFDITGTMWLVYILFVYGLKARSERANRIKIRPFSATDAAVPDASWCADTCRNAEYAKSINSCGSDRRPGPWSGV